MYPHSFSLCHIHVEGKIHSRSLLFSRAVVLCSSASVAVPARSAHCTSPSLPRRAGSALCRQPSWSLEVPQRKSPLTIGMNTCRKSWSITCMVSGCMQRSSEGVCYVTRQRRECACGWEVRRLCLCIGREGVPVNGQKGGGTGCSGTSLHCYGIYYLIALSHTLSLLPFSSLPPSLPPSFPLSLPLPPLPSSPASFLPPLPSSPSSFFPLPIPLGMQTQSRTS